MKRTKSFRSSFLVVVSLGSLSAVGATLSACGDDSSGGGNDTSDPAAIAAGQMLVAKNVCKSCHGGTDGSLSGQEKAQSGTQAYGVNLTPDNDTGLGEWSSDQIVKAILTGVDDEGEQLCNTMPAYGKLGMTEADARNIAAYLKSLPAVAHEVPESSCP